MKATKLRKIARVLGVSGAVLPLLANATSSGMFSHKFALKSKSVAAALAVGALMAASAVGDSAFAQSNGTPSSKATADINTLVKCTMSTATANGTFQLPSSCVDLYTGASVAVQDQWITLMAKPLKVSNSESIIVSPSLVTGLYTNTQTVTKNGGTSSATAMGGAYLRAVLVDSGGNEIVAAPLSACNSATLGCYQANDGSWGVELDTRVQTLTQTLSACTTMNFSGTATGTCSFTSIIDLILNTASAHTFNFIFPNVGVGVYTVKIEAAVGSGASVSGSGSAVGAAAFGLGSMVAETVRLVHDFSF